MFCWLLQRHRTKSGDIFSDGNLTVAPSLHNPEVAENMRIIGLLWPEDKRVNTFIVEFTTPNGPKVFFALDPDPGLEV